MTKKMLFLLAGLFSTEGSYSLSGQVHAHRHQRSTMSPAEVARTLKSAGFPKEIIPVFVCVARHESGLDPKKIHKMNPNNTSDHGLWQINDVWVKKCGTTSRELLNPRVNARCALRIYREQGLDAWVAYQKHRSTCLAYRLPSDVPVIRGVGDLLLTNRMAYL